MNLFGSMQQDAINNKAIKDQNKSQSKEFGHFKSCECNIPKGYIHNSKMRSS